jgi:hypothetical protein
MFRFIKISPTYILLNGHFCHTIRAMLKKLVECYLLCPPPDLCLRNQICVLLCAKLLILSCDNWHGPASVERKVRPHFFFLFRIYQKGKVIKRRASHVLWSNSMSACLPAMNSRTLILAFEKMVLCSS